MASSKSQSCFLLLQLFLSLVFFSSSVFGYSSGAPANSNICKTLIPGHGSRQGDRSPYKLFHNENAEGQIMVNLVANSQVTFAGFIVQARDAADLEKLVDGEFIPAKKGLSQARSCLSGRSNTWTHTSGQTKTQVSVLWVPPPYYNGSIVFRGTVVQVKQAYWDQIVSETLYLLKGEKVDQNYYLQNIGLLQADQAPGSSEMLSGTGDSSASGLDYASCTDRACMGLGKNGGSDCMAAKNCMALLTARQDRTSGQTEFTLSGRAPGDHKSKYFSVGFSDDAKMGDDLVVDCMTDASGKVTIGLSYNTGRSNEVLEEGATRVLENAQMRYTDGVTTCKWTFAGKVPLVNRKTFDLMEKRYHLLLAQGDMDGAEKDIHSVKTPSSEPVNLAAAGALTGSSAKDLRFLVRVHGSLMVITWLGTVSVAIIFARYFKDAWNSRLMCGVKIWFAFHRTLMVLSVTLMVIAQMCIFYYVGGYVFGAHQIVGSLAFTFALLNPVGALFRPHPDASNRWLFNWAHWLGGNIGHISAVAAILLATRKNFAGLPEAALYVVMTWIVVHVLMHFIFQFHTSCMNSSKTSDMALNEMHNGDQMYKRNSGAGSGRSSSGFKSLLLAVYILLVLILTITLVIMICSPEKMSFL